YRKLVEHPDWLQMADSAGFYTHAGVIKEADFLAGNDLGRIYRIVPNDFKTGKNKMPELSKIDIKGLVEYLNHPNMWLRTNAQRLLVDRKDPAAVRLITNLLSTDLTAEGTIHCLWTLEGLGALSDTLVEQAFQSPAPLVRKHAVLLAERRLEKKKILDEVINASADANSFVQFQVALTLGNVGKTNAQVFQPLNRILSTHINDEWFQTAALLSASQNAMQWFDAYKDFKPKADAENIGKNEFLKKTASIVGFRNNENEISSLVKTISAARDSGLVLSVLTGLKDGLARNTSKTKLTSEGQQGLISLMSDRSPRIRETVIDVVSEIQLMPSVELSNIIRNAKTTASDINQPLENRLMAIKILGLDLKGDSFTLLEKLLEPNESADIQRAAINVLLRSTQDVSTNIILKKWKLLNPKVHDVVESGFLSETGRSKSLIAAIEANKIPGSSISRNAQNRLLENSDSAISNRAKHLFKSSAGADRKKLIIDYNASTTVEGDPAKGKAVFKMSCSVCHRLEGVGADFAPNLYALSNQPKINLLTMILDPNNTIAAGYEGYIIETTDGKTFAGIIKSENALNLTLKSPGDVVQIILKSNIKSISPMSVSIMPEGLETAINKDDMANLLTYLKTLK
ncbi:MAG TPA: c-type cytochrome, partial [Flavitalea sp.]|nr:c-type cytochrome [Flavitalea sp.]